MDGCAEIEGIPTENDNEIDCSEPKKCQVFSDFNHFLESMVKRVINLHLSDESNNEIFKLCSELVTQTKYINDCLFRDNPDAEYGPILDSSAEFICGKLAEHSNAHQRQKKFKESELFVAPKEYSLGLKWELKRDNHSKVAVPRLNECKFSYVMRISNTTPTHQLIATIHAPEKISKTFVADMFIVQMIFFKQIRLLYELR